MCIRDRSTLNECFDFIGVSPINEIKEIASNKTRKIVFPSAYHFIRKSSSGKMKYTEYVKYLMPKKSRSDIKYIMKFIIEKWFKKELKFKKLDDHSREYLRSIYYKDVNDLKCSLNYNFSEWEDFN